MPRDIRAPAVFLMGPTCAGKTALAVELLVAARKLGVEHALEKELRDSRGDVFDWQMKSIPSMPPKACDRRSDTRSRHCARRLSNGLSRLVELGEFESVILGYFAYRPNYGATWSSVGACAARLRGRQAPAGNGKSIRKMSIFSAYSPRVAPD